MVKYVFIIPYRDREMHKHFFERYMSYVLEDLNDYEIIYSHQKNNLPFNRGGMKNCGFLYVKQKYPETYKDIILIFHDIDTVPYKKNLLSYDLNPNEINHYYGFDFCLGGIFAIRGSDFERINGFPSLWSWGWEDTVIYERALNAGIKVNRDQFYKYGDNHILHFADDITKMVSMRNKDSYLKKQIYDGLSHIKNVRFEFNKETNMLDVKHMECSYLPYDNSQVSLVVSAPKIEPKPPLMKSMNFYNRK
jgi:N-terminal domain of galactosyltransferase